MLQSHKNNKEILIQLHTFAFFFCKLLETNANVETETPMRIGHHRYVGNNIEENSDLNVPTSPANNSQNFQATSPFPASVHISDIDLSSPLNYGTPSSLGSVRTPRSGIRGTNVRVRPDIRTDRIIRQVNIGSDPVVSYLICTLFN